jgi:hypothetical protein
VTRFQRFGLAALVRKKRTDAGARRAVPIKMKAAIEGLALQKPPLPITALHRQVQRFSLNLGEKAPSYKVVYRIVRGLPADLLTLALEGTKAYSEAFDLVHRREQARTPFGRPIIRHSIFCSSALMANRRSPGSRSSWMTTAAPWLEIFPFFRAAFNPADGPHGSLIGMVISRRDYPSGALSARQRRRME